MQHAAAGVQTDPYFPLLRLRLRPAAVDANGNNAASATSAASASASAAASDSAGTYEAWRRLSLQLEVEGPG